MVAAIFQLLSLLKDTSLPAIVSTEMVLRRIKTLMYRINCFQHFSLLRYIDYVPEKTRAKTPKMKMNWYIMVYQETNNKI